MPFWILCFLLLTDQLVPTLPFYAGVAPSMALGMIVAAGACIIVLLVCWAIRARALGMSLLDANANGLMLIGTVVVVTILHGAVADQLQALDWSRFAASLIPLVLLLGGALALGHRDTRRVRADRDTGSSPELLGSVRHRSLRCNGIATASRREVSEVDVPVHGDLALRAGIRAGLPLYVRHRGARPA